MVKNIQNKLMLQLIKQILGAIEKQNKNCYFDRETTSIQD